MLQLEAFWIFFGEAPSKFLRHSIGNSSPKVHRYHPDLCVPDLFGRFTSNPNGPHDVMVESSVWRCHDAAFASETRNISAFP